MIVYCYDEAGWFTGEMPAPIDPVKTRRTGEMSYIIPDNTTTTVPPKASGLLPRFNIETASWMLEVPPPPPIDPLEQLQAEYDALILDLSFRTTLLELGVN
ncbi:MAG TPA: hypothetical protein GX745_08500 [Clostridiales bacterium]|nr:hypothetical protein [Clostridiales bacterium]